MPTTSPNIPTVSSSIRKTQKLLTIDNALDYKEQPKVDNTSNDEQQKNTGIPVEILELNQQNAELLWKRFGEELNPIKRGAKALFAAFVPTWDGVVLSVQVQSTSQKEKLDEEANALKYYLKRYTGVELTITIEVDKAAAATTAKPYTDEDKMKRLIEKNPTIKLLQQKFGLSLDYE